MSMFNIMSIYLSNRNCLVLTRQFLLVADKDFTPTLDYSFKEGFYFLSSLYTTSIYYTVNKHFDLSTNCLFFTLQLIEITSVMLND